MKFFYFFLFFIFNFANVISMNRPKAFAGNPSIYYEMYSVDTTKPREERVPEEMTVRFEEIKQRFKDLKWINEDERWLELNNKAEGDQVLVFGSSDDHFKKSSPVHFCYHVRVPKNLIESSVKFDALVGHELAHTVENPIFGGKTMSALWLLCAGKLAFSLCDFERGIKQSFHYSRLKRNSFKFINNFALAAVGISPFVLLFSNKLTEIEADFRAMIALPDSAPKGFKEAFQSDFTRFSFHLLSTHPSPRTRYAYAALFDWCYELFKAKKE